VRRLGLVLLLLGAALVFVGAPGGPARAVLPDEILDDSVLEGRARELSKVVRCVVCQNESIDSSNAELARELRLIVRERLVAGDSDQQVLDFLVARYGDFVLLRPPFRPATYFLWFGPLVFLGVGVAGLALVLRRRRLQPAAEAPPLNAEERGRLARLVEEEGQESRAGNRLPEGGGS